MTNATATHFSPEKAERIVSEIEITEEDGWTYRIIHTPRFSYIEVRDEDREFLGYL